MVICSFCGSGIKSGSGKIFIKTNGTVFNWCSSKCEKNQMMGRNRKKLKWAKANKSK